MLEETPAVAIRKGRSMLHLATLGYQTFTGRIRDLANDPRGVTALEYSLIAGVTVVAIGAALIGTGILASLNTIWATIQTDLATVAG